MHHILIALLVAFGGCSCSATSRVYPAHIQIGPDRLDSHVDSPLAQYYVEHYLPRKGTDPELDRHIRELLFDFDAKPLTTPTLVRLAQRTSNDFAAVYFAEREYRSHHRLEDAVARYTDQPPERIPSRAQNFLVVFVPGLFYESHPETKGDLREAESIVRSLGLATDRVKTGEADPVEANAAKIAQFIADYPDRTRPMVLVSASKGGPEVLYALGALLEPEDAERVRAWVSIGGALRGSQLADSYLTGSRRILLGLAAWWEGFPCEMVESLSTARSSARLDRARIPSHVTVLQYVAVPVSGSISDALRDDYEEMNAYGPNDGITLLTDQLLPGALVVTELGLDHRFAHPRISQKAAGLAFALLELL